MKPPIFKDKSVEDLYTEIYDSHNENVKDINEIISTILNILKFTPNVDATTAATILTPMLSNLISNKIKNSGILLELTKIIQRALETGEEVSESDLPADEIKQLLKNFREN